MGEHLFNAAATEPAGGAFPTGFIRREGEDVVEEGSDRSMFIKTDNAAMANTGTDGVQLLKTESSIEKMRWNNSSERPADDHTLKSSTPQATTPFPPQFHESSCRTRFRRGQVTGKVN